jgi:hypothetical protein
MAIMSMCGACMPIVSLVASAVGLAGSAAAKAISTIADAVSSLLNAAATIVQRVIGLELAEKKKDVAFMRAEALQLQTFFENDMRQIRNIQEADTISHGSITSSL